METERIRMTCPGESTMIRFVGFQNGVLYVMFKKDTDTIFCYPEAKEEDYMGFFNSESPGKYFHSLKKNFPAFHSVKSGFREGGTHPQ